MSTTTTATTATTETVEEPAICFHLDHCGATASRPCSRTLPAKRAARSRKVAR